MKMGFYKKMKIEYTLDDFLEVTDKKYTDIKDYSLEKDSILFHRLYDLPTINIFINTKFELIDYLQKINDYINWLGKDCRMYFTNNYNQIYPRNEFKGRDWYSTFLCINVIIRINEKRKFHTNIVGLYYSDNDECQHHEIELEGRKIISWEIDLNRSKDSVAYSVIKETYNSVIIEVNACFHNININATILLTKNILQYFKIDDCKYVLGRVHTKES